MFSIKKDLSSYDHTIPPAVSSIFSIILLSTILLTNIVKYSPPLSSTEKAKNSSLFETAKSPVLKNFLPFASLSPSK